MKKTFFTALTLLFSCTSFASTSEMMQVVKVLKGDTIIATNYKGKAVYLHLAGVDCPELDQKGGVEAKDYLQKLVQQKKVYTTFTVEDKNHALGMLSLGYGGSDVGSKMLEQGMCWYRNVENDNLRAPQRSSYKLLADQARFKKRGIWKNGDIFFENVNPDSWRYLEYDRISQPRFNGTPDPKFEGFERNENKISPSKNTDDWRKPVGKNRDWRNP